MKTVAKRLLSLALGLCLAVAGVFTIAPTVTASAATEIVFNLGANGSASHADGSTKTQSYTETVNDYTLKITDGVNMYPSARDAKGNSCIKLGTSKANGSFKFTVPADVTSVIIEVAKYKTNSASVTVNGTKTTLDKNSNDGAYNEIEVDTISTKTVSLSVSSGYRAMVNSIKYVIEESGTPIVRINGNADMQLGIPLQLIAITENIEGDIVWTSDNEEILTVDQNGVVTAVALGSATITAKVGDIDATHTIKVYPSNAKEITIAEAVEICKYTGSADTPFYYTATGTIKRIDYSYNATYDDITLTITDGTHEVKCYYLKGGKDLNPGDTIRVTGPLCLYGGNTNEFNKGSTYVKLTTVNDINAYMQLAYKYTEDVVNEEVVLKDSDFRLNCGIDSKIADVEGATSYGIRVTANGKTKDYTSETATSWAEKDGKFYVVLGLGDIINDKAKLGTEFTVQAFVVIDGEVVVSKNAKKYSVVRMVADYVDVEGIEEVQHLYDFLSNKYDLI